MISRRVWPREEVRPLSCCSACLDRRSSAAHASTSCCSCDSNDGIASIKACKPIREDQQLTTYNT
eukprot:6186274-Pleurochrysis_carterae.AAC.3